MRHHLRAVPRPERVGPGRGHRRLWSERETAADLNRPRSAGTEGGCLAHTASRLTEGGAVEDRRHGICQVRNIECVKDLAERTEAETFLHGELLRDAEILAEN